MHSIGRTGMALAVLFLLASGAALGECRGSIQRTSYPLPVTLNVLRDAAVGTVLFDTKGWVGGGAANRITCRGSTISYDRGFIAGAKATNQPNVYESGVPGIGIKVSWSNKEANPGGSMDAGEFMGYPRRTSSVPAYTYVPAQNWWIQLIKTGPIESGTFDIPPIRNYYHNLLTNELTFPPSQLVFQKRGCRMPYSNVEMPLPTAFLNDFKGKGSTARITEFGIPLVCDAGVRVSYSISGLQDEPSVLKNSMGSGLAKGVGVQLLRGHNDMRPILLGQKTFFADSGPVGGNSTIPVYARYYQTEDRVTSGDINILATLSLFYE